MHEQPDAPGEHIGRPPKGAEWLQRPRIRLGAIVALAVAAGIVAWAVVDRSGSSKPSAPASSLAGGAVGPVLLTPEALRAESRSLGQPIYWAGSKSGYTYELTRTVTGHVYVRYLPTGTAVGAKGAGYLIVATYPFPNALAALKKVSGGTGIALPGGGLAVVDTNYPKSVHVAFPETDYQVEVYDPSPKTARSVAVSGAVRPVR